MIDFSKYTCPVCGKPFDDEYDIACCPKCGAPHHKQCWMDNGGCYYQADHDTPNQWDGKKKQQEAETENNEAQTEQIMFCPRCGNPIAEDESFCGKCGLDIAKAKVDYNAAANSDPFGNAAADTAFGNTNMAYDRMVDRSYAQGPDAVDEKDEIDGVTAHEMAQFAGKKGGEYTKKFFKMEKIKSKVSWNWAAFFFPQFWITYRRMFTTFLIILIVTVLALAPLIVSFGQYCIALSNHVDVTDYQAFMGVLSDYDKMLELANSTMKEYMAVTLSTMLFFVIQFFIGLFTGLFGNYFYKKHVISKIKMLKEQLNSGKIDNNQYGIGFMRYGGTRIINIILLVMLIIILYNLFSIIIAGLVV